jgi:hypothetical protein
MGRRPRPSWYIDPKDGEGNPNYIPVILPERVKDDLLEWGADMEPMVFFFSLRYAAGVQGMHRMLDILLQQQHLVPADCCPPLSEHLALYDDTFRVMRCFMQHWVDILTGEQRWPRVADTMDWVRNAAVGDRARAADRIRSESPEKQEQLVESARGMLRAGFEEIRLNLSTELPPLEELLDSPVPPEFREWLSTPEIFFLVRVLIPCWFEHGQMPDVLMGRARQGDADALADLLQIDPAVSTDPTVAERMRAWGLAGDDDSLRTASAALGKAPRRRLSLAKVKVNMAGLISLVSEENGRRLEEPEIRRLFDILADGRIDTDIPAGQEAFQKAIQRERKFWLPMAGWCRNLACRDG